LFDIFSGESLGEGKKAYALAFTLSAQDATLTEAQIDAAMQRLEISFVEKLGATIRR
jgi:phenylalanyl-tRNA synthetase beta chain